MYSARRWGMRTIDGRSADCDFRAAADRTAGELLLELSPTFNPSLNSVERLLLLANDVKRIVDQAHGMETVLFYRGVRRPELVALSQQFIPFAHEFHDA